MRFLIDNALSPVVSALIRQGGHDVVHVRDYEMQAASDSEIFDRAANEGRTIVSADTDFGALLATRESAQPSVILFRQSRRLRPHDQAALLLANLPALQSALDAGCIAVIEDARLRVRALPFSSD